MLAERYRLDAPLGHGAVGEVWRAQDLRLGRSVAVKVLAGSASDNEIAAARFRHEARLAARLNHPHIVRVYDFVTDNGRSFLVMERVCGRSLAQELRQEGPLPLARIAEVAAHTAAGLAAAHRLGVVHRDVKPSNLLAETGGSVKIADFGIAQGDDGETTVAGTLPDVVVGTSCYLSPERVRGARANGAADVYALACSLYELLTGRPPFTGEHPLAVLRRQVEEEPVPPQRLRIDIPPELNAYLLRMLAKEPQARPTAEEVAAWFEDRDWPDGRPTAAGRPVVTERPVVAERPTLQPMGRKGTAPAPHGPAAGRPRPRRLAPTAGAATVTAAIAATVLVLASPTADSIAPTPPRVPQSSRHGGTPTHHEPGAGPAAKADYGHHGGGVPGRGPQPEAPATAFRPTAAATPSAAATSAGTASTAPAPTAPRASAPATSTPSGAAPSPTSADPGPTATTPPPTSPDTTPPVDARPSATGR